MKFLNFLRSQLNSDMAPKRLLRKIPETRDPASSGAETNNIWTFFGQSLRRIWCYRLALLAKCKKEIRFQQEIEKLHFYILYTVHLSLLVKSDRPDFLLDYDRDKAQLASSNLFSELVNLNMFDHHILNSESINGNECLVFHWWIVFYHGNTNFASLIGLSWMPPNSAVILIC